ncbi:MAG TPA: hypothetical protein VK009_18595 [Chloroflexota bacterium]|nr:hypothetical protein [Chloroflexota bacterium]
MKAQLIASTLTALGLAGALAAPAFAARPDGFHAGDASGVYIWHTAGVDHGWHLETTDPRTGGVHTYTGTLTTDGKFSDVHLVRAENDDSATIDGNGNLNFSFRTASGIDGMDFRDPGGTHITFNLSMDGSPLPTSEINLGDNSRHPASNPFTLNEPGYNGQPDGFKAGDASGVYLWHRVGVDHGWHLETTDPAKTGAHTYTGTVTTNGKFVDVQLVRAENDDSATVDGNGTLNISFKTYSGIDGVDWRVDGGTQMTFTLYEDGQLMSTTAINIGDGSSHPASDPFTLNV